MWINKFQLGGFKPFRNYEAVNKSIGIKNKRLIGRNLRKNWSKT